MSDAVPARPARLQDLAAAVLAAAEPEEALALLVERARRDLAARRSLLVMPGADGRHLVELVDGDGAAELLGREIAADSAWGRALAAGDVHGAVTVEPDALETAGGARGGGESLLVAPVDAGPEGLGALVVVLDLPAAGRAAAVEHLDAIAALIAVALGRAAGDADEVDDERGRIARDLHDLAIQELFAVGMELESLQRALRDPGAARLDPAIARSAAASVRGVERAVAEIRQIVQSLRRDRAEATLSERLRHEAGLATAGLGFVPGLRLPPDPAVLDAEVPPEIAADVVAVVRECLANAARHAQASAVAVAVTLFSEGVDRVVQVAVSDNGRGIDPAVTRRSGLANMSSRARRHQGWVDAIPLEPGTMISWRVTLPPV